MKTTKLLEDIRFECDRYSTNNCLPKTAECPHQNGTPISGGNMSSN
jgi:hypothetical protein